MPAARVGDMAMCVGPPDVIALGCFTVLIGETMAGAAAAPGPIKVGLNAAAVAHIAAATALSDNKEASTKIEHWVEFEFVDKAGKPVSGVHYKFTDPDGKESKGVLRPDGRICRDALNAGQCKAQLYGISNAKWSKDKANVGEKVKLSADVEGFEDGTHALIQIYKRDMKAADVVFHNIEKTVKAGKVEADWEYIYPENKNAKKTGYSAPEYYFEVIIAHCQSRSGLLAYKDFIEIELKDDEGNPIANVEYILYLSNGEIRKGKLNSRGISREEKLPPGKCELAFPNLVETG
jgi:hypothetical protein